MIPEEYHSDRLLSKGFLLAYDALQEMRIHYRWEAIDQENKEIELGKETEQKYIPQILENSV